MLLAVHPCLVFTCSTPKENGFTTVLLCQSTPSVPFSLAPHVPGQVQRDCRCENGHSFGAKSCRLGSKKLKVLSDSPPNSSSSCSLLRYLGTLGHEVRAERKREKSEGHKVLFSNWLLILRRQMFFETEEEKEKVIQDWNEMGQGGEKRAKMFATCRVAVGQLQANYLLKLILWLAKLRILGFITSAQFVFCFRGHPVVNGQREKEKSCCLS